MASPHDPHSGITGAREGALVAGKYRVGKVIGSGGMGVVLAAVHETLHTPVALKVLRPEAMLSPGTIGRFLQEARAAALLQSEHVARVHDFGTLDDGSPYLAMEYLHGRDLSYVLEKRSKLAPAEAVEVIRQTCDALSEAHGAGIVHRDLKPHNLFLVQRANQAIFVKVLDFGIAKVLGSERFSTEITTQSTALLGTPLYMSPEQLRAAKTADPRSDIWSLGVIFYQLLSGTMPFYAESLPELSVMVLTTDAPRLDAGRLHLSEDLVDVVAKCLRRDPADRFSSVDELAMALEPFFSNRRVSIPDLSSPILDAIATGPRRVLDVNQSTYGSAALAIDATQLAPGGVAGSLTTVDTARRGRLLPALLAGAVLLGSGFAAALFLRPGMPSPTLPAADQAAPPPRPAEPSPLPSAVASSWALSPVPPASVALPAPHGPRTKEHASRGPASAGSAAPAASAAPPQVGPNGAFILH